MSEEMERVREIAEINKKLEENKMKLGQEEDLTYPNSLKHADLEKEGKRLNQAYKKVLRKYARDKKMGAADDEYWDLMKARGKKKQQEENEKLEREMQEQRNEQNGHGSISDAERERQEQMNEQNGHGSISDAERVRQASKKPYLERVLSAFKGAGKVLAPAFKGVGKVLEQPQPWANRLPPAGPKLPDVMGGRRKTRRGRQVRRSKAKRTRREKRVRKSRKVIKRKARKSRKVIKRKAHKLRRH